MQIIPKLFIVTGLRNLKQERCYGKIHDIWCEEEKEKEDFLLPKEKKETNFGQRQKNYRSEIKRIEEYGRFGEKVS